MKRWVLVSLFCILCLWRAQKLEADQGLIQLSRAEFEEFTNSIQSLESMVKSQNEVIQTLNTRIDVLERTEGKPITTPVVPTRAPKTAGLSQGLNPDIGVVGTVQANLTENTSDGEGRDTIALKELELSFAQVVDPYSRLDAIITLNDNLETQNIDIEEAYYTHWGLPAGFQGQIGKFRSKIGKQNLMHLHQLPTADYPEVIKVFFGDEGLAASGARLQNWVPNPWDIPVEVTAEVLRGKNGNSFSGISRRPIFTHHVKTFFDVSDDVNLELGGSVLYGEENVSGIAKGDDRFGVHVFGGDATLVWNLEQGRQVTFQNELYAGDGSTDKVANQNPWGFYSLLDVELNSTWSTGVRFDYVEPRTFDEASHVRTTGISPYIMLRQSEFADFRIQYTHLDSADPGAKSDDAIILEANFLIGAHKHPVQ